MNLEGKLTKLLNTSKVLDMDNNSKIVFISDCHRGDASWKDNLEPNRNIYYAALNYYYKNSYTYIEIGDGDELWENRNFINICESYNDVYKLLYKFHLDERFHMIFGNHDMVKKNKKFIDIINNHVVKRKVKKHELAASMLYENIDIHEGLVLNYLPSNEKILVIHGHQGDIINDNLWLLSRFAVRYIWSVLEGVFGFKDTTSPAKNYKRKTSVEKKIMHWILINKCMVIAGHTHRPYLPKPGDIPYFNDGSCVSPYSITSIEVNCGKISLVIWRVETRSNGDFFANREVITGPELLCNYFK
ncbi:metallophosphoesterase [Clostridium sp. DJ247]|uniref:metallophosphoesterase n=1 Tax=Clostridium sp. DJ247 TaxID=2726188 RepID=UPI001625F154|nr:metallophosphoesterase [Clostridium sp. DJ247]MBC2582030.1 serine/threonine protein phosphatase [Clostridium sp. DJ247]